MRNIVRIVLLSLLCVACTQDDVIYENQEIIINELEKSRESQMLHFNSNSEFKEFVANKMESKNDLLEEARISFEREGRLSLLLIYNSLEKKEAQKLGLRKEEIAKVETSDSMLLYLLNENGEIGIEDKIFRIDGDFVYTYTAGNGENIDVFFEAYTNGKLKIAKGETIEYGKHLKVFRHTNNIQQEELSKNTRKEVVLFNGRKARMVAKQWNGHWAFYSSIGSSTKTQEWSQVLWWSNWKDVKTDNRLQFTASWNAQDFFEVSPRIKSKSSYNYCNCYEAVDVYDWSAGLIAAEFTPRSGGVSKHWSHWYQATPNTASIWLYY